MAIYTNLKEVKANVHGMFESSRIKATECGHLYDALVRDADENEIDVDNGVCIKIGEYTHNGLQERYATIAGIGDKVAITGSPAVVKDGFTKLQNAEFNFYHSAGTLAKAYELVFEDIFAIAKYQFVEGDPVVDAYVVLDGNGAYKAQTEEPDETYGFVGKVHSIALNDFYPMIRVEVIRNEQV